MSNVLDYLTWRGDLSFEQDSFNEIDALVLSQLSYINFDSLVSDDPKQGIMLSDLWNKFKTSPDFEERCDLGMVINKLTVNVFELAAKSARFGSSIVCGYVNQIDVEKEEQFAAVSFLLKNKGKALNSQEPFIVFRGTDDTIVGWKEDFNLALATQVPSQIDALKYADLISKECKGKIRIAGHSKGGNLAVYAGVFLNKSFRKRLERIYNFDGPGFTARVMDTEEYKNAVPKMTSWFPHHSIVGMFFDHQKDFTVINSNREGIWQHDAISWQIEGNKFVTCPELDPNSIALNKIINTWLNQLSQEKIEKIIDSVFAVFEATGVATNSEIEKDLIGNSRKMLKAVKKIDSEVRDETGELLKMIFDSFFDN